jgi:hypothetical protein
MATKSKEKTCGVNSFSLRDGGNRVRTLDADEMSTVVGGAGLGPGAGQAVVQAFKFGYNVGTIVDKKTKLSDKVSDWAAKNFPWPWT